MDCRIYLDYASTTPPAPEVIACMAKVFSDSFGNSASIHKNGRDAQIIAEKVRGTVADAINAAPKEICFTSGGSESDNMAIKGAAWANSDRGNHIIVSSVEHKAVINSCRWLANHGFAVTWLPVDSYGIVDPDDVRRSITDKTILVSVMTANNEVGSIQPVKEIGSITREHGILFHTDAVQSFGESVTDVKECGVDLLSISAHKFYGPKGVGALFIKSGTRIAPLIHGGTQERGLRGGTLNIPGVAGMGKAVELAVEKMNYDSCRLVLLRDRLIKGVLENIPETRLNGHPKKRLANNCSFCFGGIDGEALLLRLDLMGISASGGSACTAGSSKPSHVLMAMGLSEKEASGSLRFSLGRETTEQQIDSVITALTDLTTELRSYSCHLN